MKNYIFNNKVASFFAIILSVFFVVSAAQAASTISTNIQTDGNLSVTGTSNHTGLATFVNASSTIFSSYGPTYFGATATSTFTSAGLLGILTANPTYPLDVTGLGHFTGLVDAANFVATSTTATSTFAGGLAVRTSGLVYDFQTGKVGIGTASPASVLDIQSASSNLLSLISSATFAQVQMTSYRNSATTHTLFEGLAARGTKASPSAIQAGDALFSIRAGGYGTTDFDSNIKDDAAAIDLQADKAFSDSGGIPQHSGRIVFKTALDSSFLNEVMRIDSQGRVGIGVTAPSASLEVATSTSNATTSIAVGKAGQNKGSCLIMYDATGAVKYVSIVSNAFVISNTSCQ